MKNLFYLSLLFLGVFSFAANASNIHYCKYCGDNFRSADGARICICLYSSSRKHDVTVCRNKKFVCEKCGEKFVYIRQTKNILYPEAAERIPNIYADFAAILFLLHQMS